VEAARALVTDTDPASRAGHLGAFLGRLEPFGLIGGGAGIRWSLVDKALAGLPLGADPRRRRPSGRC